MMFSSCVRIPSSVVWYVAYILILHNILWMLPCSQSIPFNSNTHRTNLSILPVSQETVQELLGNSTLTSFSDNKEKQCRSWCFFGEIGCGNGDDGCECEGGLIGVCVPEGEKIVAAKAATNWKRFSSFAILYQ